MGATYTSKISFFLRRFANFLKIFRRNKRGLTGIGILVFFVAIALSGPLLTPYDPVWQLYVSGDYAMPTWFRYLPGGQDLTENFQVIEHPGFPTPASLFEEWNFSKTTSSADVTLRYDRVMGGEGGILGSAAIDFTRLAGKEYAGEVKAYLTKKFLYPYGSSPRSFRGYVNILVEGATDLERIETKVSLNRIEENGTISSHALWNETIVTGDTQSWIHSIPPIDSYASSWWVQRYFGSDLIDPARVVFPKRAYYTYSVEVVFVDTKVGARARDIEATVYIDDLNVKLYGATFGLLGTDHFGRDIFTQLVYGSRLSLTVGLLSATVSVVIGLFFGLVSGYVGKAVDEIMMRFTDLLLVIPGLPLLLVLIAVSGPSIWNLIILLGVLGWMGFARVVRAQVLTLKERPFVEAAKAAGAGRFHIVFKHILPNVMSLVYVSLALTVPSAILAEAALSWLGLFDPNVMSWGRMLFDVQTNHGVERWWWVVPPGLCIAAVSISFILVGYALDEILNPKLRIRR